MQGVGAQVVLGPGDQSVSVIVLLPAQEWDVGWTAPVAVDVADHFADFAVAVVSAWRAGVFRWHALGVDVVEESLLVGMRLRGCYQRKRGTYQGEYADHDAAGGGQ